MKLKKIYFIRHAESEDDLEEVHQRSDSPLSDTGREQAALLAGRFSHTPFNVIISSPLERAKETAEFIALASGKEIIYDESLQEIRRPKLLEGVKRDDTEFDSMREVLREKWHLPAWHYADEENFTDAKRRAQQALKIILERHEEKIVIITHGHLLTMIFLSMALGKLLTADEFLTFDTFSHMDNTGIALCEINGKSWKMKTWNDITHLIEKIH